MTKYRQDDNNINSSSSSTEKPISNKVNGHSIASVDWVMFVLPCIIYVPYALFFIESIDKHGSGNSDGGGGIRIGFGGDGNGVVDGENDRTRKSSDSNIGMYSLETL